MMNMLELKRAQSILEECAGIPLIPLRSNSRILNQDWEDSFGLQLASCFLFLQADFSYAIKGSEEPYDQLFFPWGATPLTTPLTSTEGLTIVEDGCSFDRNDKVRYLAERTKASRHLRVCWAGDKHDRNCGECEKCLRTMLNYWVNGLEVADSFPRSLSPNVIRSIRLTNEGQASNLLSISELAAKGDLANTDIARAIRSVLFRYRNRWFANSLKSFARRAKFF